MSVESQAEQIWQYAMRPAPPLGDTRHAPLSPVNDAPGRDGDSAATATDLSEEFGSMPTQFTFHGLAQSQSQGVWPVSERPRTPGSSESQKENMQLSIPQGAPSPIPSSSASNQIPQSADAWRTTIAAVQSSHVTSHVTGASLARADGMIPPMNSTNSSAPFSSGSAALMKDPEAAIRATPLKINNNKPNPFRSPTAPPSPSPPTISRTKTMPSRLNRYAPRDIPPSSQDSFAGPPVAQDLNSFARNSRILNNTFIRTTETGEVEAVYRRPSQHTTTSLSDPPIGDEIMSVSQSEHPEATVASQVFQAAFTNLSPPPRAPIVLVKDSQSDHPSRDSNNSQEHSLFSASFHLPSPDADLVETQPNTQPSEQNTQPTQPTTQQTQHVAPPGATLDMANPSPLPVPAYRRRQLAALVAARERARDEIIPETPLSTTMPPKVRAPAPLTVDHNLSTSDAVGEDRAGVHVDEVSKPHTKSTAGNQKRDVIPARVTRRTTGKDASVYPKDEVKRSTTTYGPLGDEVVPDSQEEERQQMLDRTHPAPPRRPDEGEVIPDSQEVERQANMGAPPSSPGVPLKELHPFPSVSAEPPTPTPAAVRSPLRKGKLPEGVTHTRGRPSDAKGKGKAKAKVLESASEATSGEVRADNALEEDAEAMDIDKDHPPAEAAPRARVYKSKRAPGRSLKKGKKSPAPTSMRKSSRKVASKATTTTPAPGPSTRSKKRKSDPSAEAEKDDRGSQTSSAQPTKRQRLTEPPTSTPVGSMTSSARVFARRTDKGNNYYPGTVQIKTASAMQSRFFLVKFDDSFKDEVDIQFMRRFELETEDNVHIKWPAKHRDCDAVVISTELWEDDELVDVQELGRGPDGDDFEVASKFISITGARIRQQFSERRISSRLLRGDVDFDVPFEIPPRNERLEGMSFVITMPDLPNGKRSLQKLILASGGVVYEEWNSLLTLGGNVESLGRRMSGTTYEVRMKNNLPGNIFCLADEARTTPKYLIALALGVPCLSFQWVLDKVLKQDEQQVDWPAYVLPAGDNTMTRMPASQAFNRAWWRKAGNAPNLISDPPTFKPFLGKSFLCFGTKEFLFAQNELGIFPKLLLAMGASYVEAVTDVTYVNKPPAQFDYTVVDDGEPLLEYQRALAVDAWWIKKCLVTGIEGPVPWPDPSNAGS